MRIRFFIVVLLALCAVAAFAQDENPPDMIFIIGPRLGVSYTATTPAAFTDRINNLLYTNGTYFPVTSLFGIIAEQRILLGETNSHFAFQEVLMIGGLEQSIAIPTLSLLIGYRGHSGFEFGVGPSISLSDPDSVIGVGVLAAVGWTISHRGVFVPIDLSVAIPNADTPARFALTTGFNFVMRTSRRPTYTPLD